jgi:hypothetical protein
MTALPYVSPKKTASSTDPHLLVESQETETGAQARTKVRIQQALHDFKDGKEGHDHDEDDGPTAWPS